MKNDIWCLNNFRFDCMFKIVCEDSDQFFGKAGVRKSLSCASLHGEVNNASIHSLTHSQADLFHSVH